MQKSYNVLDWYWIVGGSTTQVYSSKARKFVPTMDLTYIAWGEDDTVPTNIDTDFNLGGVLAPYLELRPIPQSVLAGYEDGRLQMLKAEPDYGLWADMKPDEPLGPTIAKRLGVK